MHQIDTIFRGVLAANVKEPRLNFAMLRKNIFSFNMEDLREFFKEIQKAE